MGIALSATRIGAFGASMKAERLVDIVGGSGGCVMEELMLLLVNWMVG